MPLADRSAKSLTSGMAPIDRLPDNRSAYYQVGANCCYADSAGWLTSG
jgi:hypothetical protein